MPTNPYEPPQEVDPVSRPDLRGLLPLAAGALLTTVACSGSAAALFGLTFGLYVVISAAILCGVFGTSIFIGRLLLQNPRA
jgi:hypothetical protein